MTYAYNEQAAGGDISQIWGNQVCQQLNRVDDTGLYPLWFSHEEPVDLSGAAIWKFLRHTEVAITLYKAYLLYTEASSANAGITLEIGKETDRDYYYTGASEINEVQWYTKELTLLATDLAAGDTLTFYSPGGKVGTGEVILTVIGQYLKTADGL